MCPQLQSLLVMGNPQRTVRASVLAQGSVAVLKSLRNKLPRDFEVPSVKVCNQKNENEKGEYASTPITSSFREQGDCTKECKDTVKIYESKVEENKVDHCKDQGIKTPSASDVHLLIQGYDTEITGLEDQLDNPCLSAAKRYALKKQVAKVRSLRIRAHRTMTA